MNGFIIIRMNPEFDSLVIDVLKMLLGNHIKIIRDELLTIWYEGNKKREILDTLKSLEEDINTLISCYISSYEPAEEEYKWIEKIFLKAKVGYYDFKSLCLENPLPKSKDLLKFILDKSGVTEEIILAMADNNLNVSATAAALYMHRNTLLYKIERLIETKGFDLKSFNDVYILINLIRS